ncbi:hypothetical protein FSP39_006666, partial [Pinctada imbricata]
LNCTTDTLINVVVPFRYTHFGEVENRVDMRGEVGLLTRNIKIRGETESYCPVSNGNCGECPVRWDQRTCGKYLYDTFGGHIKFLEGFENVHIEGVELENMGQQTSPGKYPLHFHMCGDVSNYPSPPYIRDNSIHHSFARCITIHGTDGTLIKDNVAFDILGHCYFLEDGGEKHNVFDGNLGALIKAARLIPSDKGIWFIYPREPIMASEGKGLMKYANQTAITLVDNNVVHSCGNGGFHIDDILGPNNEITPTAEYEAREIPGDKDSPVQKVVIKRITAQNRQFRKSETEGIQNQDKIGTKANKQKPPSHEKKRTPNMGVRPGAQEEQRPRQGLTIYTGTICGENLWFDGFKPNKNYSSGAISFVTEQRYGMSVISTMKNIGFGFDDSFNTGNRVFDGTEGDYGYTNYDGDKGSTFYWQERDEQIVKPMPFYYTNKDCYMRENWKMVACKLIYGKLNVQIDKMGIDERKPELEMRRDDIPNDRETLVGTLTGEFTVILGGSYSYSLHWKGNIPKKFSITGEAVQRSHTVRLAICMPKNATFDLWSESPTNRSVMKDWKRVNTTTDVDGSSDGQNYMYDEYAGSVYVQLQNI